MIVLLGEDEVLSNLNKEIRNIRGRNIEGMVEAANLIEGRSKDLCPVRTGNLKGSHYVGKGGTLEDPIAEVGCTAYYAGYVHENLEANFTVGQAKFLETAIKESRGEILSIIRKHARIK